MCWSIGSASWDNTSPLHHGGIVINTLSGDYFADISLCELISAPIETTLEHLVLNRILEPTKQNFLSSTGITTHLNLKWELWLKSMSTIFSELEWIHGKASML